MVSCRVEDKATSRELPQIPLPTGGAGGFHNLGIDNPVTRYDKSLGKYWKISRVGLNVKVIFDAEVVELVDTLS